MTVTRRLPYDRDEGKLIASATMWWEEIIDAKI